jgi:hypothetical protein
MTYLGPALIFALLFAPAIRLLSVAFQTRRAPEIWASLYFIGTSIGLPLRVLGHSLSASDPARAIQLNTVGHAFFAAATCAMAIFTWRVFRTEEVWARALVIVTIGAISITTIFVLASGQANAEQSVAVAIANMARLLPIFWAFFESTRYRRAMLRRAQLGLADPVVTNRFLLWSIWTAALAILPSTALLLRLFGMIAHFAGLEFGDGSSTSLAETEAIVLVIRVIFLVTAPVGAAALCLSFFPPERFLAFIRRRGTPSHGVSERS